MPGDRASGAAPRGLLVDTPALLLLGFILLPLIALVVVGSPGDLASGIAHPLVGPALSLSLRTTTLTLAFVLLFGTPLAWRLARSRARWTRIAEPLIDLPIVVPPAVVGVALLYAYGRNGLLGSSLEFLGLSIPFTTAAVVCAQIIVSAPFYVQSATAAFRKVDDELLLVARTLGASPARAFFAVAVPAAAPGLFSGMAMSWARSVGEFGATLLFAGNLPGRTQTMPLAIYAALESDVDAARAISVLLGGLALGVLLLVRSAPTLWIALTRRPARPGAQP
jgi:molybdate transport system permease protein